MTQTIVQQLADFVAGLRFDDLGEDVVAVTKEAIADHLGISIMGSSVPWTAPIARLVRPPSADGGCTVIGGSEGAHPEDAAMVNSAYSHACELDDTGHSGGGHSGSVAIPAALAICESSGLTGRDMILGVVIGYEVMSRIGRVLARPSQELGFHPQSLLGPFGAAATTSSLLGLDSETTAHALSIAASHASGTMEYAFRGGEVKRYHSAMATRGGVVAALLAREGLTGPDTAIEGQRGLARLIARITDADELQPMTEGLKTIDWFAVQGRTVKPYPTVGTLHTSIQAVDYLAREYNLSSDDVARVEVWINPHATRHGGGITRPTDALGAQFSLSFSVALRLVRGDNALAHYIEPTNWTDRELLRVADLVEVHGDTKYGAPGEPVDWTRYWGANVSITTSSGQTVTREEMERKGSPENPMSPDELFAKFAGLASSVLGDDDVNRLWGSVMTLDEASDLTGMARLLARPE